MTATLHHMVGSTHLFLALLWSTLGPAGLPLIVNRHPQPLAVAVGITDQVWIVSELLHHRVLPPRWEPPRRCGRRSTVLQASPLPPGSRSSSRQVTTPPSSSGVICESSTAIPAHARWFRAGSRSTGNSPHPRHLRTLQSGGVDVQHKRRRQRYQCPHNGYRHTRRPSC